MGALHNLGLTSPEGRGPWERRLLLWVVGAVVFAAVVIVAAHYFDVATESRAFCGLLCHPNRPQYYAQEVSAHADVECGMCHIGPGIPAKVMAKILGTRELYALVTNSYERPIPHPVNQLRPADVICLQCHSEYLVNEDEIRRISSYAPDENNSETQTRFVVKAGGGEGDGVTGAHWHVANPVSYIARDGDRQDIPWIGVMDEDGNLVEYQATDRPLTAEEIENLPQRQMDCIDCHSRAAHDFNRPERRVDEALAAGIIDPGLPYVKREAMSLLSESYPTQEVGMEAMEGLADFYRSEYPQVYADRQESIDRAVETLRDIYRSTVFPEMNLTWDSYPDNLGHADFPGCFRCHGDEHLNADGESIPSNCTLCHSVPIITEPGQDARDALVFDAIARAADKPDFHLEPTFLRDHRVLANESCAECHGPIEYGYDNSSFCANGACHGQAWLGVDLNAGFEHPVELTGQHVRASCNECHQGIREPVIEDCATCHQPPMEPHYGTECSQCHTTDGWRESAADWIADAPTSPHGVEAVNCLLCHDEGGAAPSPATHSDFAADSCLHCHETDFAVRVTAIPHAVEAADNCLACHGEGPSKPTSATHAGIPAESCVQCHQTVVVAEAPAIPHIVEGRGRCLVCHDAGELRPVPSNHRGWANESCLFCHEPAVEG